MAPARTPRLLPAGCALLAAAACGVPVQTASAPAVMGAAPVVQEAHTLDSRLGFGAEHTFAGGVSITVSTPKSFQPSASAYPHSDRAAAFEVEVRNTGSRPYRLSGISVTATIGDVPAIQVVDSPQGFTGVIDAGKDLAPGRTVRLNLAFAVPAQPAELWLVFKPDAAGTIAATYSGSV